MRLLWEGARHTEPLLAGQVHVWSADLDSLPCAEPSVALSEEEGRRAGRLRFERDRRRFVAGRALLRVLLGRYLDCRPAALRFGYTGRGKPFVAGTAGLHFNVSHSHELIVLAFADREVGIDVERERELPEAQEIARRYFSRGEAERLERVPADGKLSAFFRCWTRKEAFLKLTGDGFSRPLDSFDVGFDAAEQARLQRLDGDPAAASRYSLEDLRPAEGFASALAVEGRAGEVVARRWIDSAEVRDGSRRERRQDRLQGGPEPRGAVLDLACGAGQPAGLA